MRAKKPMDAAGTTPIESKSLSRIYQMIPRDMTVEDAASQDTPFWSVEKTAAAIGISVENVRRMCRDGRITHCTKVGQQWAINPRLEWPELFGGDAA